LIAAALLDGQVGPAQLEASRINAADAQALLARVEIRPDEEFSARYPNELCTRITICTDEGHVLVKEQIGYEGGLGHPMSWDRVVQKFHWLSEPHADEGLRTKLVEAVKQIDTIPVSHLMELLADVHRAAIFAAKHPGIQ
jgi:2-methylcitrate dehydratase